MVSDKNFAANYASFVWGAVASAISVISLLLLTGNLELSDSPARHSQPSGSFIFDYQTLITGFFALLGAAWTVHAIFKQIDAERAIEKEKNEQKHQALKAALPLYAKYIVNYLKQCFHQFENISDDIENYRFGASKIKPILFPQNIVDFLMEFISSCDRYDDKEIRVVVSNLLVNIQIHNSRFNENLEGRIDWRRKLADDLITTASLYLDTEKLFDYGRGVEYLNINHNYNDIHNTLKSKAESSLDQFDQEIRLILKPSNSTTEPNPRDAA